MKPRIAVINSNFMEQYVTEALAPLADRCTFTNILYQHSAEIPEILPGVEKQYDGFLVNGIITNALIRNTFPDFVKPVACFDVGEVSYYREILLLMLKQPKLDPSRLYVDFLGGRNFAASMTAGTLEEEGDAYRELVAKMDPKDLKQLRRRLTEDVSQAYREGRIDWVLTRFSTCAQDFKELGIPCVFVYPDKHYILDVARYLAAKLELAGMRGVLPAVIHIFGDPRAGDPEELYELELRKALLEYGRENGYDFIIQKRVSHFEIVTSAETVEQITDRYTMCRLKPYLEEKLHTRVCIGYGVGQDTVRARLGAAGAGEEAFMNPMGASYAMDEQENLIGPLSMGKRLVLSASASPEYADMAQQTGISALTLQKICAVAMDCEDQVLTAGLLAEKLGVTARAASKYIQKLLLAGAAEPAGTKQRKSKGRPEQLVRVKLPTNR